MRWRGCRRCTRRSKPKLLEAYFQLDAFPDARAALRALKAKGHQTGILSNGSPNMLKGAVDAAGIGGDLDAVLSVDVLKMFKPRPEVYRLVTDHYKCNARRRDLRVVQPLGRDGGNVSVGFPRPLGQPQQDAGRISRLPAAADAERSQFIGDFSLSALALGLARLGAGAYMRIPTFATAPHPCHPIISITNLIQDLRVRVPGAEGHQSRHPARRDFRAARPQRRRQDHADRHRLRHPQAIAGHRHRRRPRHHQGLPRRPLADRPGAAGTAHRRVRERVGDRHLQPRPVRQAAQSGAYREGAARAVAVGQEGQPDHDAVRRHEAPRADRQGARARAAGSVPRRADRRRRRRIAQGHVAGGARPARLRRHHHPHHALHRGSRGHGRPRRRDQQGRDHPGRGQGRADAQARQEAVDPAFAEEARRRAGRRLPRMP